MADAGAGSSAAGSGLPDDTEERYFGNFTARFSLKYEAWIGDVRRPQTPAEYSESLKRSQTYTCTTMAASHYQTEEGVELENATPVDSHMFPCKWVHADDRRLCFHVTFHAKVVGRHRNRSFFFAELIGTNRPESVNRCVMIEEKTDYSVKNCKFCSGMWHPVSGGFMGYKLPPTAA